VSSSPASSTPPVRLLLATDLSARCDRALDRAAQLVGEWQAELVVLNVLDVAASPDMALAWATGQDDEHLLDIAQQQLARDLVGLDIQATMQIVRAGDVAGTIRDIAASKGCGLVITGVARNEVFGRFLLGSTVERLARILSQPLLVVRRRARAPYQRIVVATDFSDSSREALLTAARIFPGRELVLFHAFQIPLAESTDDQPHARLARNIERHDCADFLASTELPPEVSVRTVIEHGALETTLTRYVRQHETDLVVMGTHGRSGVMSILLGSSAAMLLDWLPCDVLVVREPRSTA